MNGIITHEGNPVPLVEEQGGQPVTSSLAIAEGVGNPHSSVIRLIRDNREDLEEFGNIGFEIRNSTSGAGRPTEVAYLNEQQSTLLLTYMRNNEVVKAFKKALVKAFFELRSRASDPMRALNDPAAMRGLLLTYTEKVLELQSQNDAMRSDVEAYERIAVADGSLCITDAAKTLQVRPKDLFSFLREKQWIYRRAGNTHDLAYQSKLMTGVLEHKVTTIATPDGDERVRTQVRVTPKGMARLAKLFNPDLKAA